MGTDFSDSQVMFKKTITDDILKRDVLANKYSCYIKPVLEIFLENYFMQFTVSGS